MGVKTVRVLGEGKQFAFVEFDSPGEAAFGWKYVDGGVHASGGVIFPLDQGGILIFIL